LNTKEQQLSMTGTTWDSVNSPMLKYRGNVFSQGGEDGVLAEIVRRIPEISKTFVEFGAWDGLHLSNCAALAFFNNWDGVFIEGDSKKFADLQENYVEKKNILTVNAWVGIEGNERLDVLLRERVPTEFGILSIDIDGNDYHVWESLVDFTPTVVIIEINPSIPNDVFFVQRYDKRVNQGASLLATSSLANAKGYDLICCTSQNAFFIKKEFTERFEVKFSSLDEIYVPKCNGRIFHGYDGTVFVVGMDRIIWKSRPVSSEDFQIYAPSERVLI